LSLSAPLLAYVGLGPGQEFIPYFFALLTLLLTALSAVFRWPFSMMARLLAPLRRSRRDEGRNHSNAAIVAHSADDGPGARP
jgi:hypothetical protein